MPIARSENELDEILLTPITFELIDDTEPLDTWMESTDILVVSVGYYPKSKKIGIEFMRINKLTTEKIQEIIYHMNWSSRERELIKEQLWKMPDIQDSLSLILALKDHD